MTPKFFEERRPHNGIDYPDFMESTKQSIGIAKPDELNERELNIFNYRKLNFQRSNRIHKTFKIEDEHAEIIKSIDQPQLWMVITEDWCGDSAQNLPYLYLLSELSEFVTLKIIPRDDNLDIMDLYLTNGKSRSIPKLVVFDEAGNELFTWGPRPQELVNLIEQWKSEGKDKTEWTTAVHTWYAKNKGQQLIEEITKLVSQTTVNSIY
ncbi:MAG: thioredoxin family protein [Ignavibacteriae bacterium]|nr:thioredoxin family protein [Ignavibacteriota bacterium]NOG96732.1 thioredoxin family protein [Ignavibacteriota bacterium]